MCEPQIKKQVSIELDALQKVIKMIKQITKVADYNPEIAYLTIATKIGTKFFEIPQMASRSSTYNFLNSTI